MTLLDLLLRKFPAAKRQTLKRMVQDRRVTINGTPAASLKQPVGLQDILRVLPTQKDAPATLPFPIVFDIRQDASDSGCTRISVMFPLSRSHGELSSAADALSAAPPPDPRTSSQAPCRSQNSRHRILPLA